MDYVIQPSYTTIKGKPTRSFEDTIGVAVKSSKVNSVNIEDMFTGVNLVINSNFKDPINTSGTISFVNETIPTGGDVDTELTCIDCWGFNKNRVEGMLNGDITVNVVNEGISVNYNDNLNISGKAYAIYQKLSNPARYNGEYITVSAGYINAVNPNLVLALIADGNVIGSSVIKDANGYVFCTGLVSTNCEELYVAIGNKDGNVTATSATFTYVQAEVGKAPTAYKSKSREAESLLIDYITGRINSESSGVIDKIISGEVSVGNAVKFGKQTVAEWEKKITNTIAVPADQVYDFNELIDSKKYAFSTSAINIALNAPIAKNGILEVVKCGGYTIQTYYVMNSSIVLTRSCSNINTKEWSNWTNDAITLNGLTAEQFVSNENLLINPDFGINQRGVTSREYGTNAYSYFVDRWMTYAHVFTMKSLFTKQENGGITGTVVDASTQSFIGIRQYIDPTVARKLLGQTVTISCKVSGYKNAAADSNYPGTFMFLYNTNNAANYGRVAINSTGGFSTKAVIPADADVSQLCLCIYFADTRYGSVAGDGMTVDWVKMELGSVATPFHAPDPATELVKCQRYYRELNGEFTYNGGGAARSAYSFLEKLPLMRILPTVTYKGTLNDINNVYNANVVAGEKKNTIKSITFAPTLQASELHVKGWVTLSDTASMSVAGTTSNEMLIVKGNGKIICDAEIYN